MYNVLIAEFNEQFMCDDCGSIMVLSEVKMVYCSTMDEVREVISNNTNSYEKGMPEDFEYKYWTFDAEDFDEVYSREGDDYCDSVLAIKISECIPGNETNIVVF